MQLVTVVRKGLVGTSLKFGALESKIHIFPTIPPVLLVEPPGGSLALNKRIIPPNRFTDQLHHHAKVCIPTSEDARSDGLSVMASACLSDWQMAWQRALLHAGLPELVSCSWSEIEIPGSQKKIQPWVKYKRFRKQASEVYIYIYKYKCSCRYLETESERERKSAFLPAASCRCLAVAFWQCVFCHHFLAGPYLYNSYTNFLVCFVDFQVIKGKKLSLRLFLPRRTFHGIAKQMQSFDFICPNKKPKNEVKKRMLGFHVVLDSVVGCCMFPSSQLSSPQVGCCWNQLLFH